MVSHFETPQSKWNKNIGLNLAAIIDEFKNEGFTVGTYPGHDPALDHAADFMVPAYGTAAGKAKGDKLAQWAWDNHKALGLWYIIWHKRIISTTPGKSYWKTYVNPVAYRRGTPSGDHLNHVHLSWHLGSDIPLFKPASKPSVPPVSPVQPPVISPVGSVYPKPSDRLVYASKLKKNQKDSDSVYWAQVALGITPDGFYGPETVKAAKAFQKALGDDQDGELGILQTTALFEKHKELKITVKEKP